MERNFYSNSQNFFRNILPGLAGMIGNTIYLFIYFIITLLKGGVKEWLQQNR